MSSKASDTASSEKKPDASHDAHAMATTMQQAVAAASRGPETWNPPFCGDIDMQIKRDGTWLYMGTPIARPELVNLFARVLRREGEHYYLVTPVEKVGIRVEDAPFAAQHMTLGQDVRGATLSFTTNVGDTVTADADHPIEVWTDAETGEPSPYIHIRNDLWALMTRSVFYHLAELAAPVTQDGDQIFVVESAGQYFELGQAD